MSSRALIIAGPNGSGKTTFAEKYLRAGTFSFLSADAWAASR
ncbi:MAG: AAA family ATPase [Candidatus Eisenbacteria bacterium]|nr:AAA family ATPase [Candidatus Eisenbacteria bacterium]